jgi:hypothetical protein
MRIELMEVAERASVITLEPTFAILQFDDL